MDETKEEQERYLETQDDIWPPKEGEVRTMVYRKGDGEYKAIYADFEFNAGQWVEIRKVKL